MKVYVATFEKRGQCYLKKVSPKPTWSSPPPDCRGDVCTSHNTQYSIVWEYLKLVWKGRRCVAVRGPNSREVKSSSSYEETLNIL